jgi:hypothetical protein
MKATLAGVGAVILATTTPAFAHRLDEYLQATTIAVEKDRVRTEIRLTPGVEVFPTILAAIDKDRNGIFSDSEQHAYAERVRRDLSLSLDDDRLKLRLVSSSFPTIQEMSHGLGAIVMAFESNVPRAGVERTLVFENRHMNGMAVYLVNGLVPSDPDIRPGAQRRNRQQSHYEMDYVQSGIAPAAQSTTLLSSAPNWLGLATLSLLASVTVLWRRRLSLGRPPKH